MGLFDRFRQRKDDSAGERPAAGPEWTLDDLPDPLSAPVPSNRAGRPASRAEQLEELEETTRQMVAPAFHTHEEIEACLFELYAVDDDYDLTEDDVYQVLQRVWQERLDQEATWADEGDYRRLAAAFEALDRNGIVARMDFSCCPTCATAEMEDEKVDGSRGYVYFHEQDTEGLAPGGSDLFLAFGGFDPAPGDEVSPVGPLSPVGPVAAGDREGQEAAFAAIVASTERIGAEVADALRREGLTVDWDGTGVRRIHVRGLDWRKRLPVG